MDKWLETASQPGKGQSDWVLEARRQFAEISSTSSWDHLPFHHQAKFGVWSWCPHAGLVSGSLVSPLVESESWWIPHGFDLAKSKLHTVSASFAECRKVREHLGTRYLSLPPCWAMLSHVEGQTTLHHPHSQCHRPRWRVMASLLAFRRKITGSKRLKDDLQKPNEHESWGAEDGLHHESWRVRMCVVHRIVVFQLKLCSSSLTADNCQFSLPNVSLRLFDKNKNH